MTSSTRQNYRRYGKIVLSVLLSTLLGFLVFAEAYAAGVVSGVVFRDYNANGVRDTYEPGVGGVTVTAYDAAGTSVGSTTTAADGSYSITVTVDEVRLEVTGIPSYLQPGPRGTDSETTVTFVDTTSDKSGVDIGVNNPADYCQANPDLCTPMHINGDADSDTGLTGTLQRFPYDSSGVLASAGTSRTHTIADKDKIGSTWGVAWQRDTQTLYTAAFLKRHVGLGPNGLGAIYKIPNANAVLPDTPGAPSLFFDLATVTSVGTIPSNLARGLTADPAAPNHDPDAYGLVGKVGLGDIDISDDNSTLWAVSLNDKTLYAIPTTAPSASNVVGYPIDDPGCASVLGEWRPFAVKVHDGDVYVGGVCDASLSGGSSAQLLAFVYRFDGATFTRVLDFPLNYWRGYIFSNNNCSASWLPWSETFPGINCAFWGTYYPQPILSDIEFDNDGTMIVGIADRYGHQVGWNNFGPSDTGLYGGLAGGDILRANNKNDGTGTFTIESGAEFYSGDNAGPASHEEKVSGGLAFIPGKGHIALTTMDPFQANSGGIVKYSNSNGSWLDGYDLFLSGGTAATFGKAHGLGDLEALCSAAPIEIGNRLWIDANKDGIQDPGETPLKDVIVKLFDSAGTELASAITNTKGEYYFSSDPTRVAPAGDKSAVYKIDKLTPNTNGFEIRVDTTQAAVGGYTITTANAGFNDLRDSDATLDGYVAVIPFNTGDAGANNHTYDIGFIEVYLIGDLVWYDTNQNGKQDTSEPGLNDITVKLYDDASCSGKLLNTTTTVNGGTTPHDGYYQFTKLPAATYSVQFSNIPADMKATLQDQGADNTIDSDADTSTLCISSIVLGPDDPNEDLGLYRPGSIGSQLWCESDTNPNTTYDLGEDTVLPGVSVNIYTDPNCNGSRLDDGALVSLPAPFSNPVDTNAFGKYLFSGLPTALTSSSERTCYVTEVDTTDANLSGCSIPITAVSQPAELSSSTLSVLDLDFGFEPDYTLGNYVWYDTSLDGTQNAAEPGVKDVTVKLFPNGACTAGTSIDSTTTDANGFYEFTRLPAATYSVQFSDIPTGMQATRQNQGDDALDSDANTSTLCISDIVLGPDDPNEDLGLYMSGSIGDQVWCEQSSPANTTYESGTDSTLSNITITLYTDPDCNGDPEDGTPYTASGLSNPVATNSYGQYIFANLPVALDGSSQRTCYATRVDTTDPELDTCSSPITAETASTELSTINTIDETLDFGFETAYTLGDHVWFDTNGDGLQDSAEPGINGVTASLFDNGSCSGTPTSTTSTANGGTPARNGYYLFPGLIANTYSVQFSDIPTGMQATLQNQGADDTKDSDADPTTLCISNIVIGPNDPNEDLGLYMTGSIGDQVWCEQSTPANTTYELGTDTILQNIGISLYTDPNCDGDRTDGNLVNLPSLINPASTNADGLYLFSGLQVGLTGSSQQVCYVTEVDTADANLVSCTNPITPVTFADELTTDAPNDLEDDFGFISALLGNFVWMDYNHNGIQDASEPGIENITVNLLDPNTNTILATTQTDANGYYLFANLTAGEYVVHTVLPPEYQATLRHQGGNTEVDSNIDASGFTEKVILVDGESNLSIDAGIYNPSEFSKTLISTNQAFTADTDVAIGEILTFQASMIVSPGPHEAMKLVDTVDDGLAFVRCVSLTASDPALTTDLVAGFPEACDPAQTDPNANPTVEDSGRIVTWDLGTVTNATDQDQTLILTYETVVLDILENQSGTKLNNSIEWTYAGFTETSTASEVKIIEPDMTIEKTADPGIAPYGTPVTFTLNMAHTSESQTNAYDVIVTDILSSSFEYVPGTISSVGLAPSQINYDESTTTLTLVWDSFPLTATSTVRFDVIFNGPAPAINTANEEWTSLPIDPDGNNKPIKQSEYNAYSTERWLDPPTSGGVNNYGVSSNITIDLPSLPNTGFAPDRVTTLPFQVENKQYASYGDLWLEIPGLNITMPIVGVPLNNDNGWDVTWLGQSAGWLEGSAFPTWEGNSVITGHVWDAYNNPGPFIGLRKLLNGDRILVHAFGQVYTYEVRSSTKIWPSGLSSVFQPMDGTNGLTLLTCEDFSEANDLYTYRRMVRAVLIKVESE